MWKNISPANKSIITELWPEKPYSRNASAIMEKFGKLFELRSEIYKKIEELIAEKKVKTSMQCRVFLKTKDNNLYNYINNNSEEFRRFLICAEVSAKMDESLSADKSEIMVEKYIGNKCERCWVSYNDAEGTADKDSGLCPFCHEVVNKMNNISNG